MAKLVLTVVGADRAGLVQALADTVAAHGGNWERSELAELAGAFAGIVLVSVPDDRLEALHDDLHHLDGLLTVTPHEGASDAEPATGDAFVFTVLGNDHPGIVRDITTALSRGSLSIGSFTSRTLDAPMSGGTLFEATVSVRVADGADLAAATAELERLAGEIQVDLTVV
ncbi:MAG: ACT domain-containing protein [Microbacterium sp.]|uniref:glycine cleavage system protein R n=1 Tax=Microbacterium sp. TaxID=51671 RepID=UPI0039E3CDAB